tara:strand:- start:20 stop:238 length:219 start_codon:yes stop_codon:yes gene_type:complete
MSLKSKALLFNLISFGVLFILFRVGIGVLIPLPYLPLLIGSSVLASFLAPKFLVKENTLWIKIPLKKGARRL